MGRGHGGGPDFCRESDGQKDQEAVPARGFTPPNKGRNNDAHERKGGKAGRSEHLEMEPRVVQEISPAEFFQTPLAVLKDAADHVPYTLDPAKKAVPDLLDACRYLDVAVCSFSPLAGGFLTGKYKRDADGNTMKPTGSRADRFEGYGEFPER